MSESSADHVDVIVLGAGISGLVSAALLTEQGHRVLVLDEYGHVGGNHIDRAIGGYTFDVGSFIFQDDSPLLRYLPELLPLYVLIDPTWSKLAPGGSIRPYPLSVREDLIDTGIVECTRVLMSVIGARLFHRELNSARDFARYWIGDRFLYRSGLENYMERFCGMPAEKIDLRFAEKRMGWLSEHASVRTMARHVLPQRHAAVAEQRTNQQLARPREGFAALYAPAVARLQADGVTFRLAADLRALEKDEHGFRLAVGDGVTGPRVLTAPRLVSTIPIDRLQELRGVVPPAPLPTVTLISLFFSFDGTRGFGETILYNFSHDGAWKRLTTYSDFYGRHLGREFFAVEVLGAQVGGSVERAEQDFRAHVAASGLFVGDLRLEGSHVLDHAYPIYTDRAADRAEATIAELRAWGVESFGRQGGFQYQPTARVSTTEAEAALGVTG